MVSNTEPGHRKGLGIMKLLVLTAIIAAVTSSPVAPNKEWPWRVGQEYVYDVDTYTWTKFENSNSNGNTFKAQFIIRVLAPGHLMAKLDKPMYAQVNSQEMTYNVVPSDLQYRPLPITEEPFEIFVDGGRIKSFNVPSTLSTAYENLLKGLISALQVDLSAKRNVHDFPNNFNKESFQGLYKKMEADVTGDCETLYSVSPTSAEWRRELSQFSTMEDPIEIIKSKNYGMCKKRINIHFGVPEGAVWNGIPYENDEKQFIKHTSEHRLLAGKQGTIYKSEVISSVAVNPFYYGKQKVEVYSFVKLYLSSVHETNGAKWKKAESTRKLDSLLFYLTESMFYLNDGDKNIAGAQKILQEMTPMLQNPNQLPKADFLSKFVILVRFIQPLTREQLKQLTSSVEVAKSSTNTAKNAMWIIYRDAVAQGGTAAAFEEIKDWVMTQKVQGEEAAELISGIGASLRYPTLKVMTEFFDFAMNPDVMNYKLVNNSALLAATKFFRFTGEEEFIIETVIPRLSNELKHAIENGDSNKAQVFIRALGNLANPEVLEVYAPYLDGRIVVSKYLRTQMVASLKMLANLRDERVRAMLFSILRNTAEAYEVRVVAALNIFMAFPTAEMMQVMAHMTNNDPSTQVRAILANSIIFAAGLKNPRFAELAKTAQAVKQYIAKEKFGYRYSTNSMIDEYTGEEDFAFFRELSFIGSEDNALPKYHRTALRARATGWTEENQVTMSVSDMQQLLDYFMEVFYELRKSKFDFKYSATKIAEMLNIKPKTHEPLEGALFLENLNQQKLITFNEDDLKALITSTCKNIEDLFKGVDVHYTKILNNKLTYIVFPLAAGMPFFFEYFEPLMYSIHGLAKFKVDVKSKDFSASLYKDLDMIYARNMDGMVGFYDTLGDVYATAGVINKIQFYIPAKINAMVTSEDIKMKFDLPEKDTTFVHFSVWPYIGFLKIWDGLTVSENPNVKYIERPEKVFGTDIKFGYLAGVSYQLKGYSYSNDFEDTSKLDDVDFLTSIGTLLYQNDIALTQFDFKYLAKECKNKQVTFSFFYDTFYNQKHDGDMAPVTPITDVNTRREEITKRAAAGINSAEMQLYDLSIVFDGEKRVEYLLTAAFADSFVDNKVQGAFFYKGVEQLNAVFKLIKPQIVPLNFEKALKNKIKLTYEADLKYGDFENIHLTGFGERSEEYTDMLMKDPLAKQCLQEISKHNVYQKDCYKLIIKAHAPDYFKATVTYKDLDSDYMNLIHTGYELFKDLFSFEEEEDVLTTVEDGKMEIEAQAFYYNKYIDYTFKSKYGMLKLNKVEGMQYYPYIMAIYRPIGNWERARNWFTGYQYLPYCAVDNSKVWTFSGRSYDYTLTGSWHVVMNDAGKWKNLTILARRPSENQEEVYISYETEAGKYLEFYVTPTSVDVKSNGKKVSEGALTSYWDADDWVPLLEYYTLAEGVLVFNINGQALRIVYDKQRLIIFTDHHRSTTNGLCGRSSSEIRDDFMTPWGLVDQPELYGASFSLDGEFSDPTTAELKKQVKLKAYQPVTKYTNILQSDAQWRLMDAIGTGGL